MSTRREWTDLVKRVDALGFSVVTVVDHFGTSGGLFTPLLAAHHAAPSLRVGTLVANGDAWNPALLAREIVTLDTLTDGSVELGIGAGWSEEDYRALGTQRAPTLERIARLAEAIKVLRQFFGGGPVEYDGAHYSIETGPLPKPTQAHIPLLIGGGGRRILELAAQEADIVSLHRNLQRGSAASWQGEGAGTAERDPVAQRVRWVREAAGERFGELELHALLQKVVVTDRRSEVAADIGKSNGLSAEDVLASPHFLVGTVEQMMSDLVERRSRWGISYWTLVGSEAIDAFAPVAQQLASAS
jgi:probable F420-dependent oxidoreductase